MARPVRSPLRRLLFPGLTLLLVAIVVEGLAFAALALLEGTWGAHGRLRELRAQAGATSGVPDETSETSEGHLRTRQAIHPYLGFVLDPQALPPALRASADPAAAALGFPNNRAPILTPPGSDRVTVAVFGGSVADIFVQHGGETLARHLAELPRFAGREVAVVSAAVPSFKQPQQLMALSYLLTLGARFDVVINLDGFNDVALAPAALIPNGVHPSYPRAWFFRVADLDADLRRSLGEVAYLEELRRRRAERAGRKPWRWSSTAGLLWRVRDRLLEARLVELEQATVERPAATWSFQSHGPRYAGDDEVRLYTDLVETWSRASRAMAALAAGHGAEYYHFLQPNQYLEGSKPLSPEERRKAWQEDHPYRPGVVAGYPLLQEAGVGLVRDGIAFHDLTDVFAGIEETLYIDSCCHFNRDANRRLAKAVAGVMTIPPT